MIRCIAEGRPARVALVVAVVCLLLLGACRTTHYELELRPEADGLHRTVSMWVEDDDGEVHLVEFPQEELQRIAEIYDVPVPRELAAKHVFEKTYLREMPNDLNNSGWYFQHGSAMGSAAAYLERFGDDDIAADLEMRRLAMDRLVNVWIGWLDSEFEGDPDYPVLREFADRTARDDLWNMALYMWGFDNFATVLRPSTGSVDDDLLTDWMMRVVAYLAERDYIDMLDLEHILTAAWAIDINDDPQPLLDVITRALARKMGVPADAALPGPLAAMRDNIEKYQESFDTFVHDSEVIREMTEGWDEPPGIRVNVDPGGLSIADQLADFAFMPGSGFVGGNGDRLSVTLHLPIEPLETNGEWDEEGTVRWQAEVSSPDEIRASLADVLFATWAEPVVAFQTRHFGKVVLEKDELAGYLFWKASLDDRQTKEWDRFVAKLKPGPDLTAKLREFCFESERKTCANLADEDKLAHFAAEMIARNLESEPEPDRDPEPAPGGADDR